MERKSTIHPAYDSETENPSRDVWRSKRYPHRDKILKKLDDKYGDDRDKLDKYLDAYQKLGNNKYNAYRDRRWKDKDYLISKGTNILDVDINNIREGRRRPLNMNKYIAKAEKGKANLDKFHKEQEKLKQERLEKEKERLEKEKERLEKEKERLMVARRKKIGVGVGVGAGTLGLAGGGYALYKHNKKKKEMIEALKDPRFRRQHPELVDKYRKALIKQGIIEEAAGYYDDLNIIDADYIGLD
jgi:hypothetical protein